MTSPAASVVVAAYRAQATIGGCLAALAAQAGAPPYEVIVVDSSPDEATARVVRRFAEVRLLRLPRRAYCGEARNRGLELARGRLIAFTDADCEAEPGWLAALAAAHEAGEAAVGGAIANAAGSALARAAHLCEFSLWLPGGPPGTRPDLAGANLSYPRTLLERFGPFLAGTYGSDTELNRRLRAAGVPLRFAPAARVRHRPIARLGDLLAHELEHGRGSARVRVRVEGTGALERSLRAAASPVVAAVLLARIAARCRRAGELGSLLSPALPAAVLAWCLGEARGYLEGAASGVRAAAVEQAA